ncbi:MAG: NUDIX hydrolase [Clostridia bacterium]|nr:NUDIX hydrolase [Clostridia bacterium]
MSKLEERFISREEIFDGKILKVVKDTVELPDGEEAFREMCLHVGGVCVLPLLSDGRVIMERQYRYPHGRIFFEIPAGKLNFKGEDPLEAGKRELREETGAIAEKYTFLGEIATTPALIDEKIFVYLAEDLTFGDRELDEDEFLDVELVPFRELYAMVMRGEIKDAKTQIAILKAAQLKRELTDGLY